MRTRRPDTKRAEGKWKRAAADDPNQSIPGREPLTDEVLEPPEEPSGAKALIQSLSEEAATGMSGLWGEVPYRAEMEASFGESFSGVRAHTGPEAVASSTALHAEAYAVGEQIAFRDETPSRQTVAHELAHVVQHRRAGTSDVAAPAMKDEVSTPDEPHEEEAEAVAATVAAGGSAVGQISQAAPAGVHRRAWYEVDALDYMNLVLPGAGSTARGLVNSPELKQLIADLTASINESPSHAPELFGELWDQVKFHLIEVWEVARGLVMAEISVGMLTAAPDPVASKVAAIILQSLIITFLVESAAAELGTLTVRVREWLDAVVAARGNPASIAHASQAFASCVVHGLLLLLAVAGAKPKVPKAWSEMRELRHQHPENITSASEGSIGAMRRFSYEPAPYHTQIGNAVKSKAPVNGQAALDTSLQVKPTALRRVGVDYATGEYVVFDHTGGGIFHGHVRTWAKLDSGMQSILRANGIAGKRGNLLYGSGGE
jgi:hypothetical protein